MGIKDLALRVYNISRVLPGIPMRIVENYIVKHLFIFCLIFSLTTSGYGLASLPIDEIAFDEEAWWLEDENESYDPSVNSTQMSDSSCGDQPAKDLLNIYLFNRLKISSTYIRLIARSNLKLLRISKNVCVIALKTQQLITSS